MKKENLYLGLIFVFAFFSRLIAIINRGAYDFDALISVSIAQKPLTEMWSYLIWETHPPLHYYYLHFWIDLFGASEISTRLSSLFLCLLALAAFYFLAKEIFNSKKIAIYSCLIFSLSAFQISFSIRPRMYVMMFLFSIISFYYFIKLIDNSQIKKRKLYIFFYLLSTVFALYSHLLSLALIAVQLTFLAYLFIKYRQKKFIKSFILYFLLIFFFYLPWALNFVYIHLLNLKSNAWFLLDNPSAYFFVITILKFIFSIGAGQIENIGLLLIIMSFVIFVVKFQKNNGKWEIKKDINDKKFFVIIIFIVSLGFNYCLGFFQLRFYVISLIAFFLILGYGLNSCLEAAWSQKKHIQKFIIIISILFVTPSMISIMYFFRGGFDEIGEIIGQVEKKGDKIVAASLTQQFLLQHYYQGQNKVSGIFFEKEDQDLLLQNIKNNYYNPITDASLEYLQAEIKNNQRIIYIFGNSAFLASQLMVKDYLLEKGWRPIEKYKTQDFSYNMNIWVLQKNK